jgi:Tetracyclin repressor-like, C-terminal domain
MSDATGAEYAYSAPTGDWLNDLLSLGEQARTIMRRHAWLPPLILARPVLGPNGLVLLEHVLDVLVHHPASTAAKLEAFGIFSATTALFVHNELTGGVARQQRNATYLRHALATGHHPRLAELLEPTAQTDPAAVPDPVDRYRDILARILIGLLSPEAPALS